MQRIYIKNMVCDRCIMVVKEIFSRLNIEIVNISLGEVDLKTPLSKEQTVSIVSELNLVGFEMIDNQRSKCIEQIKNCIRDLENRKDDKLKINLSEYHSQQINYDYSYLSSLFSEVEGTTIEKYYISQKIERVKELLVYDDMSLSEIAFMLNYSSTAHLSSQFKKNTGLTPSYYKQLADKRRKPLDKI